MHKFCLILSIGVLSVFTSCNKDKNGDSVNQGPTPVSRPAGQPSGAQQSFPIGSEGGEFTTADGKLTVIVPAGAVTELTNFQVQPISNTADAGVGGGFRLLPHGMIFHKPITLRFSYEALIDSIPSEDVLSIAFQSQDGIWHMVRPHTMNKATKIIEAPTTHFSDWILVSWLKLKPAKSTVGPNEVQELSVFNYHPYSDDILAPLVSSDNSTYPLGEGRQVNGSLVKNWQLTGPGNLNGSGNKAVYKAPSTIGTSKQAIAVATLKSKAHQLLLLSTIDLIGDGIFFRINEGEWKQIPGHIAVILNGKSALAGEGETDLLTITWNGTSGDFPWGYEDAANMTITNQSHSTYHGAFYMTSLEEVAISGGSIKIDNWGPVGTTITGRFNVTPSGKFSGYAAKQLATENVDGYFRVKRTK